MALHLLPAFLIIDLHGCQIVFPSILCAAAQQLLRKCRLSAAAAANDQCHHILASILFLPCLKPDVRLQFHVGEQRLILIQRHGQV